jgi:hypothetical protein
MSNLVTVNSGSAIDGTLKAGRIAIATSASISPTGFYNMINPAGGYVFISDPKVQGYTDGSPIIYPTQTSLPADVLATINGLPDRVGSVPFDNVWDALVWVQSTGKYFVLNKTPYKYPSGNLKFYFDADEPSSYPQSGSVAYDLALTNEGDLTNGPTFNQNGWIEFDGTNDTIDFGDVSDLDFGTNSFTVAALCYMSSADSQTDFRSIVSKKPSGGTSAGWILRRNNTDLFTFFPADGSAREDASEPTASPLDRWQFVLGMLDEEDNKARLYVGNEERQTNSFSSFGSVDNSSDFLIGGWGASTDYWKGDIAKVWAYNKKLSNNEINHLYFGANIVTGGLIYALDPSNIVSYPKTGTTVYSLTGSNSATLSNGIGFENSFGGEFTFDGTDDYINASFDTLPSNGGSIEVWVKRKSTTTNAFVFGKVGTSTNRYYLRQPAADTLDAVRGNPLSAASFGTLNPDEYYHLVMAWDSNTIYAYKNGVLQNSAAYTNPGTDITDGLIGDGPGNHMEMDLAQFRLYNITLSATEVLQNYNAEYPRFKSSRDIPKEDLVLDLDAGNPNSYLSGTTWTDLSGQGNNGALANGVGYTINNGGALIFDGTDDRVTVNNNLNTMFSDDSVGTWEAWCIDYGYSGGSYNTVIGSRTGNDLSICRYNTSTEIMILYATVGGGNKNWATGVNFDTNQWMHLVCTFNNGVVKFYKNGVYQSQDTSRTGQDLSVSNDSVGIGNDPGTTTRYWNGEVSVGRIWNKTLTDEEISNLYTSQVPRYKVQIPRSTTDSLVLNLDAGDTTSYPRTGTTWYDRSGNGYNATLYNDPTFNFINGGVIDFDGTNDYAQTLAVANGSNSLSVEVVFNSDSLASQQNVIFNANGQGLYPRIGIYTNGQIFAQYRPSGVTKNIGSTTNITVGNWYHVLFVYNASTGGRLYVNGVLENSDSTTGNHDKGTNFNIKLGYDTNLSTYMNGKIALAKVYSRALTPSEVLENYKSTRSRFGTDGIVTSNLQVHWDLSNPNSFDNSSTTITDLQGTQNGAIINGMPFNPQNGGIIQSDGTNDYITAGTLGYTDYSILMWVKTSSPNSTFATVGHRTFVGSTGFRFQWDDNNTTQGRGPFIDFTSSGGSVTGTTFSPQEWFNKWQQVGVTRTSGTVKIYWNGELINTGTITGQNLDNFRVGIDGLSGIGGSDQINRDGGTVEIGNLMIYDDVLTDAEVLQNYNALKNRFGKD